MKLERERERKRSSYFCCFHKHNYPVYRILSHTHAQAYFNSKSMNSFFSLSLSPVSSLCWIMPRTHSTALQSTSCSIELLLTCNAGRLSRISVSLASSCCLLNRLPYPSRSATGSPSWVTISSQVMTAATKRKTKEEGFDDILQCTRYR